MQHSALPLPEGSELRQGLRQLRFQWAAASACLLAITILGSNSAARRGSAELGGGASMVAKAAEEGAKPARMMSMSEIQAHATAKAHVAHKAASHKTRKGPNEHAASFADEAHPNAKLVKLLNQKAATYQKAGEGQLRAAQHKQAAAAVDKKAAQKELASAAHMKMEAKNDKKRSAAVRKSFAESEKPTLQANKAMKAADKTYRHDILAMASLYPQIGQDQATGKAVPAALEAQLKNVTAHLKADQAEKKKDGQLLASAASAQSTNYNENEGSSPENLVDQSTVYGLSQDEKDEVAKAKHSMSLVEKRMEKGKHQEVVAKRVLGVAHCIQKHALIYSYDENKEQHVEAAYQRILDQCDA